ncbi:hypothetical protein AAHC03_0381 [Spirometra sp. Aus1]
MPPRLSVLRTYLLLGLIAAHWLSPECQGHDLSWPDRPSGHHLATGNRVLHRLRREAPSMRSKQDGFLIVITCSTTVANSSSSIFLDCPVRSGPQRREGKDSAALSYCYENCAPITPCQKDTDEACVPDGRSINCTEKFHADGTKSTIYHIDKRDPRVSLAYEPNNVDADEKPQTPPPPPPPPPLLPTNGSPASSSEVGRQDLSLTVPSSTPTPLHGAFIGLFDQSPWLLALMGIFAVSLLVNLIFCVRWCLLCIFTEKRKQDFSEHRTLGGILCLPTRARGSSSVLWENDVIPAPLSSDCHPGCGLLEDMSPNFRHFSTLTHGYPFEPQLPAFNSEEGRFAFINGTIKPNQLDGLYRARSAGFPRASLPGSRDWSTVRSNQVRGGAVPSDGTPYLIANPLFTDNPPVPAPAPYLTARLPADANDTPVLMTGETTVPEMVLPTAQGNLSTQPGIAGRRGIFRPSPGNPHGLHHTSSCGGATVYDDVASSSSAVLPLRTADNHLATSGNRLCPAAPHYLPSMAEHLIVVADESEPVDSGPPDPETNSPKNIYVLHSPPTQMTPTGNVDNEPPC